MKVITLISLLCISFVTTIAQQTGPSKLTGPYLGQKLSGVKPEWFLLSIFKNVHSTPVFSPDGNKVFWNEHDTLHIMEQLSGEWTQPRHLKFFEKSVNEDVPFISPDGKRLYFYVSFREDEKQNKRGIWYVDFSGNSWTLPKSVGAEINSIYGHWQFSISGKGTIYFPGRDAGNEDDFIMVSRLINGKYEKPVKVFEDIAAFCPFISPNEDYRI